jgi:hypothetical protein
MLEVKKSLPGYQPLCYVKGGLLLARQKKIFRCDLYLENIEYLCELPQSFKEKCFSKVRLLARIFRLDVRCALNVDDKFALLVCGDKIWRIALDTFELTLDFIIPGSRTALYLTLLKGSAGEKGAIVFGDYFSNPDKSSASIWATDVGQESHWHVAHKFEENEINHVHNIISSDESDKCYILTGDFGDGAAIWEADKQIKNVTPIVRGQQKYRACWGVIDNGEIIYATDTQLELNSVCRLVDNAVTSSGQIEGSSIYFGKNQSRHYFSTTVEPDEPSGNFVRDVFSYKLGKGILSNFSKIYSIDEEKNIRVEFIGKKDIFPTRLAQFGSFTFPSGAMGNDNLIAFGVALGKYDGHCLLLGKYI